MLIFIKSFIIGICAILPGVSGSIVAVTFGIYERFVNSFSNKQNIQQNLIFIITVVFGTLCGIYIASYFIIYFFRYKTIIYYILSGVISSELPFIINKIQNKSNIKIIPLVLAFLFSFALNIINCKKIIINKKISYFIGGILFSFGKIFPGISSSFFLLSLGIYEKIVIIITNPLLIIYDISLYFPFVLGTIIGFFVFYNVLIYMINNKYELTYSMIIGFIISSIIILLPRYKFDSVHNIGIVLMLTFFILFIYIKKKNDQ